MVCNTTITVRVSNEIEDIDSLRQALEEMNILFKETDINIRFSGSIVVDKKNKIMSYNKSDEPYVNTIKQNYSAIALRNLARKKGYMVKEQKQGNMIRLELRRV